MEVFIGAGFYWLMIR